jgi:hypothetical protein
MTNGGQFCYKVTFQDEERMEDGVGKVFVTYDQVNHAMTAGF